MMAALRRDNREFALCVVTGTKGSTPRAAGAKMLVFRDGKTWGTIGGGTVERKVIQDAREALSGGKPRNCHYDLLHDLQMCCGGSMDIYIEPIMKKNKLYIFGAGHTGQALARRAADFDFEITVIDDRPEYLGEVQAAGSTLLQAGHQEALRTLPFDGSTYITIMTYNHTLDREILSACLEKPHAYLGMIGSRRKVAVTRRLFEEEGRGTLDQHDEVDMPMGLYIGAEGPDEISISILAQLISVKNKKNAACNSDQQPLSPAPQKG